jgi:hypothetical protein
MLLQLQTKNRTQYSKSEFLCKINECPDIQVQNEKKPKTRRPSFSLVQEKENPKQDFPLVSLETKEDKKSKAFELDTSLKRFSQLNRSSFLREIIDPETESYSELLVKARKKVNQSLKAQNLQQLGLFGNLGKKKELNVFQNNRDNVQIGWIDHKEKNCSKKEKLGQLLSKEMKSLYSHREIGNEKIQRQGEIGKKPKKILEKKLKINQISKNV